MKRETLVDFFGDIGELDATFLVYDDGYRTTRHSYRQVAGAVRNFAQRLRDAGIARGDRIVIWGENRPEWIVAFWGAVLAGVVVVPVDYRGSGELVRRIAGIVDARAVLVGDEVVGEPGDWKLAEVSWAAGVFEPVRVAPGDLCEIIFTSGATAEPKGVTITHGNILANIVPVETEVRQYRKWARPFRPVRFLNLLPLSHMFGQSMAAFIPPMLSGEVIFIAGFHPRDIARQIRTRRISVLVSVPKILDVLREYVTGVIPEACAPGPAGSGWMKRWWRFRRVHNLFGWKFWAFIVGAAPLPEDVEAFWRKLAFVVIQGYGLTETAPIVTLNHPFHTAQGSVGKPIAGVELKLADDGEILVRGGNVTPGYYNASPEDDVAFRDGWFHTGDIGAMDGKGQIFVRGRKKEMIVTPDGLNVFPEDVEWVLDAIAGVRESAVVGVQTDGREQTHALLALENGVRPEDVIAQANAKLEPHQQIRGFSVWAEGALPRTEGTGKLKRVALRDWAMGRKPAPIAAVAGEPQLLAGFAADTPIEQLGLSSLDRVEMMLQAERTGVGEMDERAFQQAKTVGELREMARQGPAGSAARDEIQFPRWAMGGPARALRRAALPFFLLPLLRVFAHLRVRGRERLDGLAGPVIFAMNHQSILDASALLAALPARFRYSTATAAGTGWFGPHFHPEQFGWFARFGNDLQYYLATLNFNMFPLAQHEAGARESLRFMGELVSRGQSILIFPEGVRTDRGEIRAFQPGVAMMAARLRVPVVPVRLEGMDRVLHRSWRLARMGRVTVTFGAAVEAGGEDYAVTAKRVEDAVRGLGVRA